ncbi:uncharacterized protein LOC142974159 [Anticarsia gemmatalis]|uniref:uncharacterized protein LOC142974159 n=1 Tax=Anticarsia gemmatalis TaxID=129554 RepID=UPI003F76207C
MDKVLICFIFFTAICTGGVWSHHARKVKQYDDSDGKIVGGNETTIETYPYQAYLLLYDGRNYYQCGGSIVSNNYIVTAAHCLTNIQRIYIRIGSTNSESGGRQYETTSFASHPMYNSRTSDFDVGVIRVSQGMQLDGANARAIKLVNSGYDPAAGENLTMTGWGATSQNGNTSTTLMVVQVPVVDRSRCNQQLGGGITSRMICAGVPEGGKDTCQGDSGGPAVGTTDKLLTGITSFGYGCAQPNAPGVYTSVGNRLIRLFIRMRTGV